jgi:hypothetical protein
MLGRSRKLQQKRNIFWHEFCGEKSYRDSADKERMAQTEAADSSGGAG